MKLEAESASKRLMLHVGLRIGGLVALLCIVFSAAAAWAGSARADHVLAYVYRDAFIGAGTIADVDRAVNLRFAPHDMVCNLSWMPDGRGLVFAQSINGQPSQVYYSPFNALESWYEGMQALSARNRWSVYPLLSPDGTAVVMLSSHQRVWRGFNLFIAELPHGELKQLLRTDNRDHYVRTLAWSPDSQTLALELAQSSSVAGGQISLVTRTGIETPLLSGSDPAWSPDGRQIAYRALDGDLYLHDLAAGTQTRLTETPERDQRPVWLDERRLGFIAATNEWAGLATLNLLDGSIIRLPLPNFASISQASWSPDGTRIAFSAGKDGFSHDLYLAAADGSDLRLLAQAAARPFERMSMQAQFCGLAWRPRG